MFIRVRVFGAHLQLHEELEGAFTGGGTEGKQTVATLALC